MGVKEGEGGREGGIWYMDEVSVGGGGCIRGCILGMSRPGWVRESEYVRVVVGVCLGSFLARFVSTQNGRSERRERREEGGGGLAVVFVLEGFLTRRSRTTLEGGSRFHEANQPNRCSSSVEGCVLYLRPPGWGGSSARYMCLVCITCMYPPPQKKKNLPA